MKAKTLFILVILVLFAACGNQKSSDSTDKKEASNKGKITCSGAWALYPMAIKWSEEYQKLHPGVTFDIQAGGAGKGMTDALTGTVDLGMVSRDIQNEETGKGAFPIAVAKDAVIPTFNFENPFKDELLKKGVSKQQFTDIYITGNIKTWGQLLGTSDKTPIQLFTRSDAAGAPETWAKYLGKNQENLLGTAVFGDPGVADAVTKNKFAMGFNNINYVYDLNSKKPFAGILPLPIDIDSNGTIDTEENNYEDIGKITIAILEGRFPSPPARPLYFVSKNIPQRPEVIEFLKWVLTDGQIYVQEAGYVKLTDQLLQSELGKLNTQRPK